jgi:hypothetical protein
MLKPYNRYIDLILYRREIRIIKRNYLWTIPPIILLLLLLLLLLYGEENDDI